jgi:hypothetical protein
VPHLLWTTKCESLHNDNWIAVAEGICHSVSSELVIGTSRQLGNTHVAIQISKSFKEDELPNNW